MRYLILALALLTGCRSKLCPVYHVPASARPCRGDCVMWAAVGPHRDFESMERVYTQCLAQCPGVTVTQEKCP